MGTELLNTAIESVVDLTVQQSYHELAKIAKDCAAGAVLVSAAVSLAVALFLYVSAISYNPPSDQLAYLILEVTMYLHLQSHAKVQSFHREPSSNGELPASALSFLSPLL